jgi:hypothetical protein
MIGTKGTEVFGAVENGDEPTPSGRQTVEGDSPLFVEGSSTIDDVTLSTCIEVSFFGINPTAGTEGLDCVNGIVNFHASR